MMLIRQKEGNKWKRFCAVWTGCGRAFSVRMEADKASNREDTQNSRKIYEIFRFQLAFRVANYAGISYNDMMKSLRLQRGGEVKWKPYRCFFRDISR